MGKGKGSFDHWAARVAVNQVVLEIKGQLHEQVIRDAFRLAGVKLPGNNGACLSISMQVQDDRNTDKVAGLYEVVKKGDPPVVGITKLENGLTVEDLKNPRKKQIMTPEVAKAATSTTPSSSTPLP